MLDPNKMAAKKSAGGPPGVAKNGSGKIDRNLQKQFAKLIGVPGADVEKPDIGPVQASTGGKVSSKKALKWARKKFGDEGLKTMAQGNGVSEKKWAVAKYKEHLAAKAVRPESLEATAEIVNPAMQALVNGAAKKRAAKAPKQPQDEPKGKPDTLTEVKTNALLESQSALNAFIDGPVKNIMDSFVRLFVSRNTDGTSDEAALALDACRIGFDACGLLLTDVKPTKKAKTTTAVIKANTLKPENAAKPSKTRERKPLTKAQREAKNKKDRARRKAAKGGKK